MAKRNTVPKSRNAGTMSEAAFFGMIRSALRRLSMYWKPIAIVKAKNKRNKPRDVIGKHKFEYQCNECKGWFQDKEIQVDHIIEAGSLTCLKDLTGFVERLFCEEDGFQILCHKRLDGVESCHRKKTNKQVKITKKK